MDGPSFSTKKRLRKVKESANAMEVTPRIPLTTPFVSVEMVSGTALATLDLAAEAPDSSTPTLLSQPSALSAAAPAWVAIASV
jgi:hypothetical protein